VEIAESLEQRSPPQEVRALPAPLPGGDVVLESKVEENILAPFVEPAA
jgi:hypothetical protein